MTVAIAVRPERVPRWIAAAVEEGGGTIVPASEAEGLVWLSPRDVDGLLAVLAEGPGIRWVQLPWAGVEAFAQAGVFSDGRLWTCAKGVYAEEVAEHALALALAGLRHLPERARARTWGKPSGTSLLGGKVTIVGGGGITESLIRLLQPFGVETTVVRRTAEPVEGATRTVTTADLLAALPGADVVVLALALTPETERIIAEPELRAMADHAWLVNVARGRHVDTGALVRALHEGWIGGAALDVTDPEPLPDDHPLWALPNCIITPHTANTPEMAVPVLSARIRDNVARFADGRPLVGPVDAAAGY